MKVGVKWLWINVALIPSKAGYSLELRQRNKLESMWQVREWWQSQPLVEVTVIETESSDLSVKLMTTYTSHSLHCKETIQYLKQAFKLLKV